MQTNESARLSRPMVLLFAVATGLTVANLWYAQPLLDTIARELDVGTATAGYIVTTGQAGYALGLLLLVPLGDLLDRRKLIPGLLAISVVGLAAIAAGPSIGLIYAGMALVGLTTVGTQIIIPFAATLAADHERGRVIGLVMSGLLLGTMLSRALSGLVAQAAGWRAMYALAAVLTAIMAAVLYRALPDRPPTSTHSYPRLLLSVAHIVRDQPVLRYRAMYGALTFVAFNALWTPIAFHLAAPPWELSQAVIGLFSLIVVPTVFVTGLVGKLADRGHSRRMTAVYFALMLAGTGIAAVGSGHIAALAAGAFVITLAAQCLHITNQSEIYRLDDTAHSRVTTAYMVTYFAGGMIGSAASSALYSAHGWDGVTLLLAGVSVLGLLLWAVDRTSAGPTRAQTILPPSTSVANPHSSDNDSTSISPRPVSSSSPGVPTTG